MAISPIEIRKQEFKKSFRGYDPGEVRTFLDLVASEMENLLRDWNSMSEKVKELDAKVDDYRRMENILQDTLTTTQQATDELKKNAQRESEMIIENARTESKRILNETRSELSKVREEIAMLKHQKLLMVSEFRGLLESYQRLLERLEKKVE
ncbi:MAG TPA: DivIVA domain-containing protein [bacterium (Candidatus Stahlbacteria)]|nr:DivIVA domain-containing protein [Candidatus Stahlbacteria bacterium]